MGTTKNRWKISIYSSLPLSKTKYKPDPDKKPGPPPEFICPISRSLMSDPVIVSTGQTFERVCVTACVSLSYNPAMKDGSTPDFSVVIPNLALKSSIASWVRVNSPDSVRALELDGALRIVRGLIVTTEMEGSGGSSSLVGHAGSELTRRKNRFASGESGTDSGGLTPLALATRPSCFESGSSVGSEFEVGVEGGACEDGNYVAKMKSTVVHEQEEGVVALRRVSRSVEGSRVGLCTPRLLFALRCLITSKYANIQVNSVAALVNLSLEKPNKVKIVRAGFVPPLIEVLRGRSHEAQEHACGAFFSLALNDDNKTAIGALGALQPLVHIMMRSESERARHDGALALYHLSLVLSNRSKLVKLGAVQHLLGMVKSGQMPGRALLILCNLGACNEGRAAMFDAGAVVFFVELLRKGEFDSESSRESCVAVIFALSNGGGLRFRGLAKAAGAVEVLRNVAEHTGRERARDKARRVLEMLKAKEEDEEDVDWEKVLELGFPTGTLIRAGGQSGRNSSEF